MNKNRNNYKQKQSEKGLRKKIVRSSLTKLVRSVRVGIVRKLLVQPQIKKRNIKRKKKMKEEIKILAQSKDRLRIVWFEFDFNFI